MTKTTRDSIEEEIKNLESQKEALLDEEDVIRDEVNVTERDLNYLKQQLEAMEEGSFFISDLPNQALIVELAIGLQSWPTFNPGYYVEKD